VRKVLKLGASASYQAQASKYNHSRYGKPRPKGALEVRLPAWLGRRASSPATRNTGATSWKLVGRVRQDA